MPVEIEVPTEHLHETIHEEHHKESGGHGEHGHGEGHAAPHHAKGGGFTLGVALSSALLAVTAAVAALYAGHHANEAMLDRVEAGNQWAYYQAKGIKAAVLKSKIETLAALDKPANPKDEAKSEKYGEEQKEIESKARHLTDASEQHLDRHNTLAGSVTFFQVAIALGAIAVLTKRKEMWWVSMLVGLIGVGFAGKGMMPIPEKYHEIEEEAAREAGTEAAAGGEKGEHAKAEKGEHGAKAEGEGEGEAKAEKTEAKAAEGEAKPAEH